MITDNPVRDAEKYFMDNRPHLVCRYCGAPIYYASVIAEGDYYYEIDGDVYCENCFSRAARNFLRKELGYE